MFNIVTIDGPASSGKGTLSRKLAKALGYKHIDNGSVFRTIALSLLQNGVDLDNTSETEILNLIAQTEIELYWGGDRCRILLNGQDTTDEISALEVGSLTSRLASNRVYFTALAEVTRNLAKEGDFVSDGRAVGTFIFPDAEIKIFISASPEIRAERRYQDLINQGKNVSYEQVLADVAERDYRDRTREFCPLIPAEGSILIDTSNALPEESLAEIMRCIQEKKGEDYMPKIQ